MGRTDKEIYRVIDNVNSYYRINSESKKELLLNKYPNAAAAYSLRLLDGYYRGPLVRVRRDDGVEVDVYPDYNNQLSLDSLVTNVPVHTTNDGIPDEDYDFQQSLSSLGEFVGATGYSSTISATDATVCVWYDQSSTDGVANDNDASQNVADNQPLIVSSGVIVTENGKSQIDFDGTSSRLDTTISTISQPFTSFQIVKGDVLGTVAFIYSATSSAVALIYTDANAIRINAGVNLNSAAIRDTNQTLLSAVFNGASSAIYKNGSSVASGNAGTNSLSNLIIGSPSFAGQRFDGKIQELVVYPSNQSTNRTDIEEDINDFYQIDGYTPPQPLLDEFGGAAAAYSLRLLSSTYTGPLVRIRRTIDNTEVDVYPDSDGQFSIYSTIQDGGTELTTGVTGGSTDKTTLHEFLYGQDTDCMVVVWYDQSGNGNDATQTTTSKQPKVYDSATGVVTNDENGLPCVGDLTTATTEMSTTSTISGTSSATLLVEMHRISTGNETQPVPKVELSDGTNTYVVQSDNLETSNAYLRHSFPDFSFTTFSEPPTIDGIYLAQVDFTTGTGVAKKNDDQSGSVSYTPANTSLSAFHINLFFAGSANRGDGQIQEVILWPNDTYNAQEVIDAANDYYDIYTP